MCHVTLGMESMRVGIDYWNTISHNVETFTDLARALLAAGHEVHIVTAVGHVRKKTVRADIEALDIPHTDVHVVIFDHPREAPTRKWELPPISLTPCSSSLLFERRRRHVLQ